jgi:hypothetical protein
MVMGPDGIRNQDWLCWQDQQQFTWPTDRSSRYIQCCNFSPNMLQTRFLRFCKSHGLGIYLWQIRKHSRRNTSSVWDLMFSGVNRKIMAYLDVKPCDLIDTYVPTFRRKLMTASHILKMEAAGLSETLASLYQTTRLHDSDTHNIKFAVKIQ